VENATSSPVILGLNSGLDPMMGKVLFDFLRGCTVIMAVLIADRIPSRTTASEFEELRFRAESRRGRPALTISRDPRDAEGGMKNFESLFAAWMVVLAVFFCTRLRYARTDFREDYRQLKSAICAKADSCKFSLRANFYPNST